MSEISLAEVQLLIADKSKELANLYGERSKSLINSYRLDKGMTEPTLQNVPYELDVIDATKKADELESQILFLKSELTKANCLTEINYTDDKKRPLTLQQGIIVIKQMRESLGNVKYLGDLKETRSVVDDRVSINGTSNGYTDIRKPTYSTSYFKTRYEKMTKQITKLEVAISSANYSVTTEVPDEI